MSTYTKIMQYLKIVVLLNVRTPSVVHTEHCESWQFEKLWQAIEVKTKTAVFLFDTYLTYTLQLFISNQTLTWIKDVGVI